MIRPQHGAGDTATGAARPTIRFVLEQHVGHETYASNLRAAVRERTDVACDWNDVRYRVPAVVDRAPASIRRIAGTLAGWREVRMALRSPAADVTIFNTQVPAALAGRRRPDRYVVITDVTPVQYDELAHGYGHRADRAGPIARWKQRVNERVFRNASRCVGWSQWTVDSMVDDYRVASERTVVVPPGVDVEMWRPATARNGGQVHIVFVGGELHRKGGDLVVAAMRHLPDDVILTLVTRTYVAASDRVRVVDDMVPNDGRLVDLVRHADIVALPSRAETFGIAAIEAAACGIPVVASRVGGLAGIVLDGQTGLLIPPDDPDAVLAALERLVRDEPLRRRLGEQARRRAVDHFDARANADRLIDLAVAAAAE